MFVVRGISRFRMRCDPDLEATRVDLPISVSAEKPENFIGELEVDFPTFSRLQCYPLKSSELLLWPSSFGARRITNVELDDLLTDTSAGVRNER